MRSIFEMLKNNEEKAYYITQYLDLIKSTLYTQTMYAEFEKEIHVMMEKRKKCKYCSTK
jgi:oligoendopeptidase F